MKKLKIRVRCDDGVQRAILIDLGTFNPDTKTYSLDMDEHFLENLVEMLHDKTGKISILVDHLGGVISRTGPSGINKYLK